MPFYHLQEFTMTTHRYSQVLIMIAAVVALAGCGSPNSRRSQYSNSTVPYTTQTNNTTMPNNTATPNAMYYRGTQSSMAPTTTDASINANVVAAVAAVPRTQATNIQVTTYNSIVSLRGVADSQLVAQNIVQAARQVPGVQSVNYDIQVLQQ
jgi:osmotically-inducible protein OsmY